jgi:hypothetical protein
MNIKIFKLFILLLQLDKIYSKPLNHLPQNLIYKTVYGYPYRLAYFTSEESNSRMPIQNFTNVILEQFDNVNMNKIIAIVHIDDKKYANYFPVAKK